MRKIVYQSLYQSPIGNIIIMADKDKLLKLSFSSDKILENENILTRKVKEELDLYFNKKIKFFSFYNYDLTIFQRKVLELVEEIPYGETKTYYEIASKLGNGKAVQAVLEVISNNPYPILIPCHRIVSKNMKMISYRGGLKSKEYLLNLEKE